MQWRSAPTRWLWAWRSAAVGEELIDAFVARIESVTAQMRAEGTDIHLGPDGRRAGRRGALRRVRRM